MAEASLTLATAAPPRRRAPRSGGPYGHKSHTSYFNRYAPQPQQATATPPTQQTTAHMRPPQGKVENTRTPPHHASARQRSTY
eukprot:scaffold242227_cov31-Tisochrysis_lutea.AAC.1